MKFGYLKDDIQKKELGGSNKQEKYTEDKVLALNSGEIKQEKRKLFKGTCKIIENTATDQPLSGAK